MDNRLANILDISNNTYIGVDIGINGGIAFICNDMLYTFKITNDTKYLAHRLSNIMRMFNNDKVICYIEKQQAFPKQGVCSVFKLGYGYGIVTGTIEALGIPTVHIRPRQWMSHYTLPKDKKDRKNTLKIMAQDLYPSHKVVLWNSDAIMLAHYAMNTHRF